MRCVLVLLCACALSVSGETVDGHTVQTVPTDVTESLKPSQKFAFLVFEKLIRMRQGRNMIMSVQALLHSLTMLYEGAAGETETLLRKVVNFPADKSSYRAALKIVHEGLKKNLGPHNVYTSGARLFPASTVPITDTYKQILADHYPNSGIEAVDYKQAAEAVRAVNSWVDKATNGTIQNIVNEGNVNRDTELMIVNVEYFKGLWKFPFKAKSTQDMPFHLSSRVTIEVPTMFVAGKFQVRRLPHLTMLKLPYEDSKLSFVVVLPKPTMSLDYLEWFLSKASEEFKHPEAAAQQCEVFLPKFTIEDTLDMSSVLRQSGLEPLFAKDMNLTTMIGNKLLSVSDILQKARVQVDELGSTASAAQVTVLQSRMMEAPMCLVLVDRPFLFMIQEDDSGLPLFVGKLWSP